MFTGFGIWIPKINTHRSQDMQIGQQINDSFLELKKWFGLPS